MPRLCVFLIAMLASVGAAAQQIRFDLVQRDVIEQRLHDLDRNDTKRELELKHPFDVAGCKQISEQPVKGLKQPNLICTLPGETAQTIIVGAHFEHVDAGQGVVDNWSGASLLPSLLESLLAQPRHHTYVFIGFAGEERGLVGSRFYVSHATPEERAKLAAMVNLDTLGLGPTEVWTSHADPALLQDLLRVANSLKLPLTGMNVDGVGTADSESFAGLKVPRMDHSFGHVGNAARAAFVRRQSEERALQRVLRQLPPGRRIPGFFRRRVAGDRAGKACHCKRPAG